MWADPAPVRTLCRAFHLTSSVHEYYTSDSHGTGYWELMAATDPELRMMASAAAWIQISVANRGLAR